MGERAPRTAVIGLGNPLMGDDGFGLRALSRLLETTRLPPGIDTVDGGTWGMNLLPLIEDAEAVLFLDAIERGLPAGTPVCLTNTEIPRALALKVSPHQIDLREVLAVAALRGRLPERMTMIGVQPERIELHEGLSSSVESGLDEAVAAALDQLRGWGHDCVMIEAAAHA